MSDLVGLRVVRSKEDCTKFVQVGWLGTIVKDFNNATALVKYDNLSGINLMQDKKNIQIISQEGITSNVSSLLKDDLPALLDLSTDIVFTVPQITFNKQEWLNKVALMSLDDLTTAFIKKIETAIIAIDKDYYAPMKKVRDEVKEVIEAINLRRADLVAKQQRLEKDRQEAKRLDVETIIADMKAASKLPPEYLANVILKSEYLQVTFTGKKLKTDIEQQFATQQALYDAAELAKQNQLLQIKARESLIAQYNAEYGFEHTYSKFTFMTHTDEQVLQVYKNSAAQRDAEKQRQEVVAIKATESPVAAIQLQGSTGSSLTLPKFNIQPTIAKGCSSKVQQKLLVTANDQMEIMQAVATLKKAGFDVKFIE